MAAQVKHGLVVFRRWDDEKGLSEITQPFGTIDELFGLCLSTGSSLLVDRIIIEGEDEHATPRTLTLVFQSVSIQDSPPGEPDRPT